MVMIVKCIYVIGWSMIAVIPQECQTLVQSGFVVLEVLKEAIDCTHLFLWC